MEEVLITDLDRGFEYQIGDIVVVETKHYGPWQGHVAALDDDGSIVVKHSDPRHPNGATYVDREWVGQDVTLLLRAR